MFYSDLSNISKLPAPFCAHFHTVRFDVRTFGGMSAGAPKKGSSSWNIKVMPRANAK